MGAFHSPKRGRTTRWRKRRRDNRVLEKCHDAVHIDVRVGTRKKGTALPYGRATRSESRHGAANKRVFRGRKVKRGRRATRRMRYPVQANDAVLHGNRERVVKDSTVVAPVWSSETKVRVRVQGGRPLSHADGWGPRREEVLWPTAPWAGASRMRRPHRPIHRMPSPRPAQPRARRRDIHGTHKGRQPSSARG